MTDVPHAHDPERGDDPDPVETPVVDAADVYRAFAPAVLGFVRAHRVADPEDLLGEVFYRVARDLPGFADRKGNLREWVFGIAHRVVDEHRADSEPVAIRDDLHDRAGVPPETGPDPALVDALSRLTDAQREVLALRFVADLRLSDVARITGRNLSAVKELQARALRRLNQLLESDGPTTGD